MVGIAVMVCVCVCVCRYNNLFTKMVLNFLVYPHSVSDR
jgi:hypothetical protein